jgi:hypothetical protein
VIETETAEITETTDEKTGPTDALAVAEAQRAAAPAITSFVMSATSTGQQSGSQVTWDQRQFACLDNAWRCGVLYRLF